MRIELCISESLELSTDKNRLRIICNNLISNAIKYYDKSKPDPYLKISSKKKDEKITISFEDNGLGMTSLERDKIFDMFYRIPSAATKVSGSGIGLYILNQTLEKIRGKISVTSSKGEGSTFNVTLPLK